MKRKILSLAVAAAASGLAFNAQATTFTNQGAVLGYGAAANNHTLFGNFKNPAFLAGDDTVREYGLGLSLGIDVELAGVNNMDDNFEKLQDDIENFDFSSYIPLTPATQAAVEKDSADLLNGFLNKQDQLSIAAKGSVSVPLVVQTKRLGGFMLAYSMTAGGTAKMLRNGQATADATGADASTTIDDVISTNAALAFTTFQMSELSAAYAMNLNSFFKPTDAQINAGVRLKLMNGAFNRSAVGFDELITNQKDLSDQIEDQIDGLDNFSGESKLGIDLGVQYIAKHYLVGLSLENVNSPSFKYEDRGTVNSFYNKMDRKITFDPKARLEGAFYSQNRRWTLAAFADLNETKDLTGLDTKQYGASASYASPRWFMPELRLGYTGETAGNEMNRVHAGLTLGAFNLDVAANSTDFDVNKENSIALNMSLEFAF